jgi:hypothetical protein
MPNAALPETPVSESVIVTCGFRAVTTDCGLFPRDTSSVYANVSGVPQRKSISVNDVNVTERLMPATSPATHRNDS